MTSNHRSMPPVFTVILCLAVFLAPLLAGKLTPIPALSIQALVLTGAVSWVIRGRRAGELLLPGRWTLGLLIGTAVCFLGSVWHTASLGLTMRELLNFGSFALVFLMVSSLRNDRKSFYAVLGTLVFSSLLVGTLGVKEYLLAGGGGWRVFSTFFNPDFLVGFTAMMLPVALGWYLSRTSTAVSIISGLTVLLMFGSTLMTGSRFGAIAAVVGIIVFGVLALSSGNFRRAQAVRLLIILIPVVLVYLILSRPLTARVASTKAESHSGGFRIQTWIGTAHLATDHPVLGTGLGTFAITYPKYARVGYTRLTHNTYLQVASEAGIPAAVLLILVLASACLPVAVSLMRRRIEAEPDEPAWMPNTGLILSGLLGGAAASMARNAVDSDWYVSAIGLGFAVVLGLAVALGGSGLRLRVPKVSGILAYAVLAPVILGTLLMLAAEVSCAMGHKRWSQDPGESMRLYAQAASLDPFNAEYHRRMGMAGLSIAYHTVESSSAELAAEELLEAVRLEPENAKNYYQLARVCEFFADYEKAQQAYDQALDLSPHAIEVMLSLARMYERADMDEEAIVIWKRMAAVENSPYEQIRAVPELVSPEYIFAHAALGREAERRGDTASAMREYRQALDRAARYEESIKVMGAVLDATGQRNRSMEKDVALAKGEVESRLKALSE